MDSVTADFIEWLKYKIPCHKCGKQIRRWDSVLNEKGYFCVDCVKRKRKGGGG